MRKLLYRQGGSSRVQFIIPRGKYYYPLRRESHYVTYPHHLYIKTIRYILVKVNSNRGPLKTKATLINQFGYRPLNTCFECPKEGSYLKAVSPLSPEQRLKGRPVTCLHHLSVWQCLCSVSWSPDILWQSILNISSSCCHQGRTMIPLSLGADDKKAPPPMGAASLLNDSACQAQCECLYCWGNGGQSSENFLVK